MRLDGSNGDVRLTCKSRDVCKLNRRQEDGAQHAARSESLLTSLQLSL